MSTAATDIATDDAEAELRYRRTRRAHHLMILVGVVVAIVLAFALEVRGPTQVGIRGLDGVLPPSCRFRSWTGLDCPSCGLTRAFVSIAHGDFAAAWRFNPVGPLVFAAFLFQAPYRAWQIRRLDRGEEELKWRWVNWSLWGLMGLALAQWAVRLFIR